MAAIYDSGGILAIMATKRRDDPVGDDLPLATQTSSLAARIIFRRSKIAFLVLKRLFLKFNLENPYDVLYQTYWGVVFQE